MAQRWNSTEEQSSYWPATAAKASTITNYLAALNGTLYFPGIDSTHGTELWKSDGTIAGTSLVADIRLRRLEFQPSDAGHCRRQRLFRRERRCHGYELWKSDGTAAGTTLVKDITSGSGSSFNSLMMNLDGKLLFEAGFNQLWISDGTTAGTQPVLAASNPDLRLPFPNELPAIINGVFYCQGRDTNQNNAELWRTDGTAAGTYRVKDIVAGSGGSYPNVLARINGRLLFYTTDGSATSLWTSDGTDAGTQLVSLGNAGTSSSITGDAERMAVVDQQLYFTANDDFNGRELWKTDGTTAGTSLVKDITPGPGRFKPLRFRECQRDVAFYECI